MPKRQCTVQVHRAHFSLKQLIIPITECYVCQRTVCGAGLFKGPHCKQISGPIKNLDDGRVFAWSLIYPHGGELSLKNEKDSLSPSPLSPLSFFSSHPGQSYSIAQPSLEFKILLHQPPECWDYRSSFFSPHLYL